MPSPVQRDRINGDGAIIALEVQLVAALIAAGAPTQTAAELLAIRQKARSILQRIASVPLENEP